MLISFYTSRVVLEQLGIDDFGIYNVVGSIVAMFSSLRTLFSASTQRFLNYEMGRGNYENLQKVFNYSVFINLGISLLFIIVVEIVGLWFINDKINVVENRLTATKIVFQLSVVSSVFSIIGTSFDAEVIAHERMDFFAYLSVFEGIMKLVIASLLAFVNADKLVLYSSLLFVVSFTALIINALYCRHNFAECKFNRYNDYAYLKSMTGFAMWNFLGKTSYAISQSGINMVLNVFGGTVVNAARGIAIQLNAATNQFLNNVNIVINPYCTKIYAEGEYERFFSMLYFSSKIYYFVQLCLVIPLTILSDWILSIWLGTVPEYSSEFLKLILIWSLIRAFHSPIDTLFKAKGEMKLYQLFECIILVFPILFSWLVLSFGAGYGWVFRIINVFEAINLMGVLLIARSVASLPLEEYAKEVILKSVLLSVPFFLFSILDLMSPLDLGVKFIVVVICEILTATIFGVFCLSKNERLSIISILKRK